MNNKKCTFTQASAVKSKTSDKRKVRLYAGERSKSEKRKTRAEGKKEHRRTHFYAGQRGKTVAVKPKNEITLVYSVTLLRGHEFTLLCARRR